MSKTAPQNIKPPTKKLKEAITDLGGKQLPGITAEWARVQPIALDAAWRDAQKYLQERQSLEAKSETGTRAEKRDAEDKLKKLDAKPLQTYENLRNSLVDEVLRHTDLDRESLLSPASKAAAKTTAPIPQATEETNVSRKAEERARVEAEETAAAQAGRESAEARQREEEAKRQAEEQRESEAKAKAEARERESAAAKERLEQYDPREQQETIGADLVNTGKKAKTQKPAETELPEDLEEIEAETEAAKPKITEKKQANKTKEVSTAPEEIEETVEEFEIEDDTPEEEFEIEDDRFFTQGVNPNLLKDVAPKIIEVDLEEQSPSEPATEPSHEETQPEKGQIEVEKYKGIGAHASFESSEVERDGQKKQGWMCTIDEVLPGSPAEKMGLKAGDQIFVEASDNVKSWQDAAQSIRDGNQHEIIAKERHGEEKKPEASLNGETTNIGKVVFPEGETKFAVEGEFLNNLIKLQIKALEKAAGKEAEPSQETPENKGPDMSLTPPSQEANLATGGGTMTGEKEESEISSSRESSKTEGYESSLGDDLDDFFEERPKITNVGKEEKMQATTASQQQGSKQELSA